MTKNIPVVALRLEIFKGVLESAMIDMAKCTSIVPSLQGGKCLKAASLQWYKEASFDSQSLDNVYEMFHSISPGTIYARSSVNLDADPGRSPIILQS